MKNTLKEVMQQENHRFRMMEARKDRAWMIAFTFVLALSIVLLSLTYK